MTTTKYYNMEYYKKYDPELYKWCRQWQQYWKQWQSHAWYIDGDITGFPRVYLENDFAPLDIPYKIVPGDFKTLSKHVYKEIERIIEERDWHWASWPDYFENWNY